MNRPSYFKVYSHWITSFTPFIFSLFSAFFLISTSQAKVSHEQALNAFDQGKSLYKKKDYSQAIHQFRTCFRLIQENKCLYYLAASTSKIDPLPSCFEPYLAWQRYLDHCDQKIQKKGSRCQTSWIKQAQKQKELQKKRCSQQGALGSERLQSQKESKAKTQSGLKMSASFHCQYKSGSNYINLKSCDGATLREGDRVRLSVKPFEDGYLYILLFNESGQSQMVFPGENEKNQVPANQRLFIPHDPYYGGWFEVDEVSNVTEILSVVFAKERIKDLELARGANVPPDIAKSYHQGHRKGNRELIEIRKGVNERSQVMAEEIVGEVDHVVTHFRFRHQ